MWGRAFPVHRSCHAPQAERMSTLNIFTIINITFRWLFGLPVPNAAIYLGVFLPYAR